MTLSPGARLGPYEIVLAIGAGGGRGVPRAGHGLNRDAAIKVLPAAFAQDPERRKSLADPHPKDGRFIMLRRDTRGISMSLVLVLNWAEELKDIMARGGTR